MSKSTNNTYILHSDNATARLIETVLQTRICLVFWETSMTSVACRIYKDPQTISNEALGSTTERMKHSI